MADQDVHSALSGIQLSDVHIDSLGRAVITNPDLVAKLSQVGIPARFDPGSAAAGNIICTGSMPSASREILQGIRNAEGPQGGGG